MAVNCLYTLNEYGSKNYSIIDLREVVSIHQMYFSDNDSCIKIRFKNTEMLGYTFKHFENLQEEFRDIKKAWGEVVNEK